LTTLRSKASSLGDFELTGIISEAIIVFRLEIHKPTIHTQNLLKCGILQILLGLFAITDGVGWAVLSNCKRCLRFSLPLDSLMRCALFDGWSERLYHHDEI
jgi:hypothetical protein